MTALPGASQSRFTASARFEHTFYVSAALVLLALVAAGFAPTFFARDVSVLGPLPSAVLVHGIAGTAWLLLFATQVALVATRWVVWHRRLGLVAAAVAVVFVASGAVVIVNLERSHGAEPLTWRAPHLFTNVAPLTSFVLLVAAGIWQRATAARHKRLMLLAAVVLAPRRSAGCSASLSSPSLRTQARRSTGSRTVGRTRSRCSVPLRSSLSMP